MKKKSKEAEIDLQLVKLIQGKDKIAGDKAFASLLIRCKKLIHHLTHYYPVYGMPLEDRQQFASIELWKLAKKYRLNSTCPFALSANVILRYRFIDAMRLAGGRMNIQVKNTDKREKKIQRRKDILRAQAPEVERADNTPVGWEMEHKEEMDHLISSLDLPLIQEKVLRLKIMGYNYDQIALFLGKSSPRISQIMNAIRAKAGDIYRSNMTEGADDKENSQ